MVMRPFTLEEIARITGGAVDSDPSAVVLGLALDSGAVSPGNLFAALRGERTDGHRYATEAIRNGAAAVLVQDPVTVPEGAGVVTVDSVEAAIRRLGMEAREAFSGEVIGIVGSCGKTTTKAFAASLLGSMRRVYASPGNRNNLLGLPETLMNADVQAEVWILEMGISLPGEMARLAPISRPTGVIFTGVAPVHTEFFPDLKAIRDEKANVFQHASADAFAVLNGDDPLLAGLATPDAKRTLRFGMGHGSDVRVEVDGGGTPEGLPLAVHWRGERVRAVIPLPGVHNAMNFAAACAAGCALGLPLKGLAEAAPSLSPESNRSRLVRLSGDLLLFDDSYNSNPAAAELALRTVCGWDRPVLAVLGEMLELGTSAEAHHRRVGEAAAELGVKALLCVGGSAVRAMEEGFARSGRPCEVVESWEDGDGWVSAHLEAGDILLVKGSRGLGLDGLVTRMTEQRGAA